MVLTSLENNKHKA